MRAAEFCPIPVPVWEFWVPRVHSVDSTVRMSGGVVDLRDGEGLEQFDAFRG